MTVIRCVAITGLTLNAVACSAGVAWRTHWYKPQDYGELHREAGYTKVHTHDGSVYVLRGARIVPAPDRIVGLGQMYDADRLPRSEVEATWVVPVDSVALVQSDELQAVPNDARFMYVGAGAVTGILALYCQANPKSCFGSCPTFYAGAAATGPILAEGFSSSIARSLQEVDVDPLPGVHALAGRVTLTMTNEALESHAVDALGLLAVERLAGGEIVRSGSNFLALGELTAPLRCHSAQVQDCTAAVRANDGAELHAGANRDDLATPHAVELTFPPCQGRCAVVVTVRNSLMQTWLFYTAWGWLGNRASDYLLALDNSGRAGRDVFRRAAWALGDLQVQGLAADGGWQSLGHYEENGPIAQERVAFVLPDGAGRDGILRLRLLEAQGHYRIDRVAVGQVVGLRPAREVALTDLLDASGKSCPAELARLREPGRHLITWPGDTWTLQFADLAATPDTAYFLRAEGWYAEWQQPGAQGHQDEAKFLRFLSDPGATLRELAPRFQTVEAALEPMFWQSRVRRPVQP